MIPRGEAIVLDEQDFEEMDQLLDSLGADDGLHLDGAQGLLTALAVGPRPVGPEHWLPVILGGEPVGAPGEELQRLLQLLLRLEASIISGLEHYIYDSIFAEEEQANGERVIDAGGWCTGFGLGVDLNAEVWELRMQEDRNLVQMLAPIVALGVDDGVFSEIRSADLPALSEAEREEVLQQLPGLLVDVRQYWQEHPPEDAPPIGATLH
jgi:uncharacterized protein